MRLRLRLPLAALVTVAAAVAVALPVLAADPGELRDRIAGAEQRERSLDGQIAELDAVAARTQRALTIIEGRRAEVQADLARDEARLAAVEQDLEAERRRLARLRKRLAEVRELLGRRLVTRYKAADVDLFSVVLNAHSFSELVERADFLRRIQRADENILRTVRSARAEAAAEARRLAVAEARQREVVGGLRLRRNALASMSAQVAARKATLERVRSARAAALEAARGDRRRLQSRLRAAEEAIERAAAAEQPAASAASAPGAAPSSSSGGPWAIPADVVMCESGGQNLPPNHAGASGYYQIIPETWRRSGGTGPAAHLAPKAEQDRVAARIWANDGADAWVCSGIVGR